MNKAAAELDRVLAALAESHDPDVASWARRLAEGEHAEVKATNPAAVKLSRRRDKSKAAAVARRVNGP